MDREKYIKYLAYQLINKLFWIIALLAIVCILTINVMWIHNIFLGLFSIAEVKYMSPNISYVQFSITRI